MTRMRKSIAKVVELRVFRRAGWHCTYCGCPLLFGPTLKLFEQLSPGHGYYHRNGKRGVMLAEFDNSWASCDHIVPHSLGGLDDELNLVASCWACNRRRSNREAQPPCTVERFPRPQTWDGLASLYPKLPNADPAWCRAIEQVLC